MQKIKNLDDINEISDEDEDITDNIANKEKVQKILEKLDEKEQDLLIQVAMYGMTYADYGRLNGITREAVRQRYNKIIKKVKKESV